MPVINSGVAYFIGDTPVQKLYAGAVHVWPFAPKPTVTSVSPTEYHHADAAQQMTINGTGFLPNSEVWLNGVRQNTMTYVSATQLKATVDPSNTGAADLSWPVLVRNPAPGGGDSNSVNVTVVPEPTLTSISPTSRLTTDPETTVTLTGTNFTPECIVKYDGGNMSGSTYVNRTTMTCKAGWNTTMTQNLKVVDEKGHATVTKPFTVNTPPPVLAVTSASGSIDTFMGGTIYLTGTNFKAPMTMNVGDRGSGQCDINENYAVACTVISATEATSFWSGMDGHNSIATADVVHKVRVTTPDGTSAWCNDQPVGFGT